MNLTYYFSALFVGAILAIIVAIIKHKKEQEEINKIIYKNKELIQVLNELMDEVEKKIQGKNKIDNL